MPTVSVRNCQYCGRGTDHERVAILLRMYLDHRLPSEVFTTGRRLRAHATPAERDVQLSRVLRRLVVTGRLETDG